MSSLELLIATLNKIMKKLKYYLSKIWKIIKIMIQLLKKIMLMIQIYNKDNNRIISIVSPKLIIL